MGFDDFCNTGLVLGLGFESAKAGNTNKNTNTKKPTPLTFDPSSAKATASFEPPSLTLGLSSADSADLYRQDSAASSFSNNVSVKREREIVSSDHDAEEEDRICSRASDEDDDAINGRKKLRLTKAQSALLEESFKIHSTLNPKQKQELARQLKLRPRQVEVWFQNRRARTKLKQTEVDCEFLKKCCETLTDENRRLQKELQELKALKLAQPLYMQLPAATLTMCPSCERIGGGRSTVGDNAGKNPFTLVAPKPHHHPLFNPFTNPSAAC